MMDTHTETVNDKFHNDLKKLETIEESLVHHELSIEKSEKLNQQANHLRKTTETLESHCKTLESEIRQLHEENADALDAVYDLSKQIHVLESLDARFRDGFARVDSISRKLSVYEDLEDGIMEAVKGLKRRVVELEAEAVFEKRKAGDVAKTRQESEDNVFMVKALWDDNHALIETLDSVKDQLLHISIERDGLKKEVCAKSKALTEMTEQEESESRTTQLLRNDLHNIAQSLQDAVDSIKQMQEKLTKRSNSISSVIAPSAEPPSVPPPLHHRQQQRHQSNNNIRSQQPKILTFFQHFNKKPSTLQRSKNVTRHSTSSTIRAPNQYPHAGIAILPGEKPLQSPNDSLDWIPPVTALGSNGSNSTSANTLMPPTIRRDRKESLLQIDPNWARFPESEFPQSESSPIIPIKRDRKESLTPMLEHSKTLKPSLVQPAGGGGAGEGEGVADVMMRCGGESGEEEVARSVTPRASFQIGDIRLEGVKQERGSGGKNGGGC
ncbi:UNVERIFIED_CONTAM: hypothetical protein HDU68_005691 [Siphonaria sp. JEL0065]|nr:hypothetical protein HDU68_005691 [Siphonaria sp. JEL0065]